MAHWNIILLQRKRPERISFSLEEEENEREKKISQVRARIGYLYLK